jgi:hypothetical protein
MRETSSVEGHSPKPRSMSFGEYKPTSHDSDAPVYVPVRLARRTLELAGKNERFVVTSKAEFAKVAPFERVVKPSDLPSRQAKLGSSPGSVPRAKTSNNVSPASAESPQTSTPGRKIPRNLTFGTFLSSARQKQSGEGSSPGDGLSKLPGREPIVAAPSAPSAQSPASPPYNPLNGTSGEPATADGSAATLPSSSGVGEQRSRSSLGLFVARARRRLFASSSKLTTQPVNS